MHTEGSFTSPKINVWGISDKDLFLEANKVFRKETTKVNGKPVSFNYIGFEHEGEAVYGYIEGLNISSVSKAEISTNIMYDFFDDQVNIMHFVVNGNRKSTKLNFPDKETTFSF